MNGQKDRSWNVMISAHPSGQIFADIFRIYDLEGGGGFDPNGQSKPSTLPPEKRGLASNTSHCKDLDLYPILKIKIKRICSTGTREESTNPPFLYNETCSFHYCLMVFVAIVTKIK